MTKRYEYIWVRRQSYRKRVGQSCSLFAECSRQSIIVEFADGERVIANSSAVKLIEPTWGTENLRIESFLENLSQLHNPH